MLSEETGTGDAALSLLLWLETLTAALSEPTDAVEDEEEMLSDDETEEGAEEVIAAPLLSTDTAAEEDTACEQPAARTARLISRAQIRLLLICYI